MYLPAHFEETDRAVMHATIDAHPLATWVTQSAAGADDGLLVNQVPFMLDRSRGPHGTLVGHVARANPVWRQPRRSVLVFQGPQAYISPNWYTSKHEHGKVVPTWNYAVVHAHGMPRSIEQRDELLALVTRLTDLHEGEMSTPARAAWQVSDAPPDYIDQMLHAIVGIEIPIDRLVGKWKVSQNRSLADRQGVQAGLQNSSRPEDSAMADLVGRESKAKPA